MKTTKKTSKTGRHRDEPIIGGDEKGQMMVGGGLETAETERTRKMGATWSATQVCLGPVKAGLGGHDDGVSGGRRGGREGIDPVMETGTSGMVGSLNHQ